MDLEKARFNMIEQQIRPWDVLDQEILDLLAVVKREQFVPQAYAALAFVDMEIPLPGGENMMPPRVEARFLQDLNVRKHENVLEIGAGSGYMAAEEIEKATSQLKKVGRFEGGIYHRDEGEEGKKNVDGYQALWEHVNGRPMVYPRPRYHDPVMMYPEHYDWLPVAGAPGVSTKRVGAFGERGTEAGFLKLDPGAKYEFTGRRIGFVLDGAGKISADTYEKHTAFLCEIGERAALVAAAPTEILVLRLPVFEEALAA